MNVKHQIRCLVWMRLEPVGHKYVSEAAARAKADSADLCNLCTWTALVHCEQAEFMFQASNHQVLPRFVADSTVRNRASGHSLGHCMHYNSMERK